VTVTRGSLLLLKLLEPFIVFFQVSPGLFDRRQAFDVDGVLVVIGASKVRTTGTDQESNSSLGLRPITCQSEGEVKMMSGQSAGQSTGTHEFKCKECGKMLSSENELREHEKTHKGQSQQAGQERGQGQQGGQTKNQGQPGGQDKGQQNPPTQGKGPEERSSQGTKPQGAGGQSNR
jgi:hypothetical protein